ncbi:MAG: GIY-YIG nuclease family protein [Candidatus Improbicoccus devescovinae]|nr:MAG: GIY-YIG nuclease family protein [Candidatus Improbicoccus devescovinae]
MSRGIVYILTNPCLNGWVKIGMSARDSIETRLAELNRPANIPLSYRAYAIYEVENPQEVEKQIHNMFDIINEKLHAREILSGGRIREREFFHISPEKAFAVFESVSKLRGDNGCLTLVTPNSQEIEEEQIAEQIERRPSFKFSMLQIPVGTELKFVYDESFVCYTKDNVNKVKYEGNEYTLSGLAQKLLIEEKGWKDGLTAQGSKYFTYQGSTLLDLRDISENEDLEDLTVKKGKTWRVQ